jgi:nucleoside-diphosphate-sugar epimerase
MTRVAITGATGYVGRFIVNDLLDAGHHVIALGRTLPSQQDFTGYVEFRRYSLSETSVSPDLFKDIDVLVHAAFHHVAGKYRGGEGDDPDAFIERNVIGSKALFEAAKAAGVKRVIFLSSRAVYGTQKPGSTLFEDTPPNPDTLYGKTKLDAENMLSALADNSFIAVSLRSTGVYGSPSPSYKHKWQELFSQFSQGEDIAPRIGTEVHGEDLAAAVSLLTHTDVEQLQDQKNNKLTVLNVSDILLDRHTLLKAYASMVGQPKLPLPEKSDASTYNQMDCSRLQKLGWQPRGKLDLSGLAHDKD